MEKLNKMMGHSDPKYSEQERNEMKRFSSGAIPYLMGGVVFNIVFITLVLKDVIDLSKFGKTRAKDLPDMQSRIGYVLKYSTPGVLWLLICIRNVIHIRVRSPAMDPLSGNELLIEKYKNILNNSLEQFVLSLVSQLILVQYLDSYCTIKYIPALSLMFILGRITFSMGYPQYRSFGLVTTLLPTVVTIAYIVYKFFELYF